MAAFQGEIHQIEWILFFPIMLSPQSKYIFIANMFVRYHLPDNWMYDGILGLSLKSLNN